MENLLQSPKQKSDKEKNKLLSALTHIEELVDLLSGNEYQQYLYTRLTGIEVEIKRQLSHYE
jgi:hypothetical protein